MFKRCERFVVYCFTVDEVSFCIVQLRLDRQVGQNQERYCNHDVCSDETTQDISWWSLLLELNHIQDRK